MIYTEDLTDSLVKIFGKEVLTKPKSTIRGDLEDNLTRVNKLVLEARSSEIREAAVEIYTQIKEVDNEFTEHYINELN